MDKMGAKLRELNLPRLRPDRSKKLAIFGTGEVAERFLYDISEEYGEDIVEFFIDSRNISPDFHGKKIVKPDALKEDAHKNDRDYLLASFSSTATMKKVLTDAGISGAHILEPMKKCSVDYLLETVDSVKTITAYPVIDSVERLERLMEDIAFFIPADEDAPFSVDLFTSFEYEAEPCGSVRVVPVRDRAMEPERYDIVLIWDGLALCDEAVRDLEHAFCIDSDLLLHQSTKIFGAVNNKIIDSGKRSFYREMSLRNWEALKERGKALGKAYVFGSGPSMRDWVYAQREGALQDGVCIVCNEFHNSAEIMRRIDPDVYVLFDLAFFGHRLSDSLEHIIEVIRDTKCKLVIPDTYVRMVHCKYKLPDDKLIGFDTTAKDICFPDTGDLRVCKSNNVVCVFSLPIATSLCREIHLIGCDGRDENFVWGHSTEMLGEETKNGREQDSKLGEDGERRKYNEHCAFMERVIALGEEMGRQYDTLTPSYIPVLRDRLRRVKVSVIVPIHNSAEYLARCLDSLTNQTLKEIEIILIDDASRDGSPDMMRAYEQKYGDKIKCIYLKENLRQGGARNIGVQAAAGEYIMYVDSDDFVDTDICEKLYKKAAETDSDIVFCDYYECDAALTGKKWVSVFFRQQTGRIDSEKRKYVFFQKSMCGGKLIRKRIIDENHITFPEKVRYEDIATTLLYSLYADKIEKVYEPLYYYVQYVDSTSNHAEAGLYRQHLKVDWILYENLKERGFYDSYREESEAFLIRYSPVILLYDREKEPSMKALEDIAEANKRFVQDYRSNKYFGCDILEPFYKKCYEILAQSPHMLAELYGGGALDSSFESYDDYYAGHLKEINRIFEMCSDKEWNVAVWGAGQKGSSFLRIADPDCRVVRCVIDKNPLKHNTYMKTGHAVRSFEDAAEEADIILVMNKYYFECTKHEIGNGHKDIKAVNLDMYLLMSEDYELEDFVE